MPQELHVLGPHRTRRWQSRHGPGVQRLEELFVVRLLIWRQRRAMYARKLLPPQK